MLTSLYTVGVGVGTVLAEGMKRAGKDLTPESFKGAMETFKDFKTGGIVPPVTYTKTSHAPTTLCRLYRADPAKGVMVAITDWRTPKKIK
jgi:branched-chain amino acid transport system substrate-binding protein